MAMRWTGSVRRLRDLGGKYHSYTPENSSVMKLNPNRQRKDNSGNLREGEIFCEK